MIDAEIAITGGTAPLQNVKAAYEWNQDQVRLLDRCGAQIARVNDIPYDVYRQFLRAYKAAPIVLWMDDIRMAAISGYEHFVDHTLGADALRPTAQLWITSSDVELEPGANARLYGSWGIPEGFTLASNLVTIFDGALWSVFVFGVGYDMAINISQEEQLEARRTGLMPTQLLPRILNQRRPLTAADATDAKVHAMIEFMNLPMVDVRQDRLPRPDRRRLEKAGLPEPDLRVITLRRKQYEQSSVQRDVEWSCRWIVGGHWRKQWCPSSSSHKPVFIAPYVKGPDDKPLKTESAAKAYIVKQ